MKDDAVRPKETSKGHPDVESRWETVHLYLPSKSSKDMPLDLLRMRLLNRSTQSTEKSSYQHKWLSELWLRQSWDTLTKDGLE